MYRHLIMCITSIFVVISSFSLYIPVYAQDNFEEKIPQAVRALLVYAKKYDIPLSYIRYDLLEMIEKMKDEKKQKILKILNMEWELEIEDAYYTSAWFEVRGTTAYMYGRIDHLILSRTKDLFAEHPDLEKIIMIYVPGSIDDFKNFEAIKYIRKKDIILEIHPKGFIASGGVDFLLAGTVRNIYRGAKIGVHSWRYNGVKDAIQLKKDDPRHNPRLNFYEDIGMDEAYYWFVLDNATADDVHRLTEDELQQFDFTETLLEEM